MAYRSEKERVRAMRGEKGCVEIGTARRRVLAAARRQKIDALCLVCHGQSEGSDSVHIQFV
jgi:hypothetical protein